MADDLGVDGPLTVETGPETAEKPLVRDAKGRVAGGSKSLNPRGRPIKGRQLSVAEAARIIVGPGGADALRVLWAIATNPKSRDADRIHAVNSLIDRGYGKAVDVQVLASLTGPTAATSPVAALASGALELLLKQLPAGVAVAPTDSPSVDPEPKALPAPEDSDDRG